MSEAEAKAILEQEGYTKIHTWFDSPETEYFSHTHAVQTAHIIIEGEMLVQMLDVTKSYGPGDRVDISAGLIHVAKMGTGGCTYVSGEKSI